MRIGTAWGLVWAVGKLYCACICVHMAAYVHNIRFFTPPVPLNDTLPYDRILIDHTYSGNIYDGYITLFCSTSKLQKKHVIPEQNCEIVDGIAAIWDDFQRADSRSSMKRL